MSRANLFFPLFLVAAGLTSCADSPGILGIGKNSASSSSDSSDSSNSGDQASDSSGGSSTPETMAIADLNWPSDQLLPSFPKPAATVDHFYLRESAKRMEAEGSDFQHAVGKGDGDGWAAQKGDGEGHLIYGPYISHLPTGENTAVFSLKRLGDVGSDTLVAKIDVFNATTKTVLAENQLLAKDFSKTDAYQSFSLAFSGNRYDDNIETRVFFNNNVGVKVDWISLARNQSAEEMVLFSSLKGIVNRQHPRLFSYEGDDFAEGAFTWLKSLEVNYNEVKDNWSLISKYKGELKGLLVFDPDVPDTLNLASTVALSKRALVVSPALADILGKEPYNLPVIESYRGRFANKVEVYSYMLEKVWPSLSHRLVIGINPSTILASLREYSVASGAATFWLNPANDEESKILNGFLSTLDKGSPYLGWWPEEEPGIARASEFGVMTIASDFSSNLTFHSGMPRDHVVKAIPTKPALQNKIYVAFILSDGDNLQYIEHLMRKLWGNSDRGKVPMGWTLSPASVDAMPGALSYYHKTATDNDNLIAGPSGLGYVFPDYWKDKDALRSFVKRTETYIRKAGFKIITVWNTVIGSTSAESGEIYADLAPSLLGLTSQNTGGGLTIFSNKLPSMALSCNYCTSQQSILDHINRAAKDWNGNEPRFIVIQAQPWTDVTPTTFLRAKEALGSEFEVVRPDHFFMLLRESKGLSMPEGL